MIEHKILEKEGIGVAEPDGPLSKEDFTALSAAVDTYLASHDTLNGLLIRTRKFPGWEDFQGLVGHIRFVRDHHRKIRKVALVSDSKMTSIAPKLGEHFLSAEVRAFDYGSSEEALAWLRSA